jgi:glucokinase
VTGLAFGVDLGGSAIKLGLVDRSGAVRDRATFATPPAGRFAELADSIADALLRRGPASLPLGLATPGYLDPATGVALDGMGNVPVLRGHSLPEALRARGFARVRALNDGVAAALGEARFGAGRFHARFALVTMGTGIGGAVVIDGAPVAGANGEPPEFGAIVVDGRGTTLEGGAGAAAFAAEYRAHGGAAGLTAAQIVARATTGDLAGQAALDAIGRRVAHACGTMINALALDACLIGGGIAAAGDLLLDPIRRHLPDYVWPFLLARTRIERAATGNDAGLLGAALVALSMDTPT